jgi:hypothetical protein
MEQSRMAQITMRSAAAVLAIAGFLLFAMAGPSWSEAPTAAEHLVPAPGGFLAPTLEGPWRTRITLNAWLPQQLSSASTMTPPPNTSTGS